MRFVCMELGDIKMRNLDGLEMNYEQQ
jgi:hypothetical protein